MNCRVHNTRRSMSTIAQKAGKEKWKHTEVV